MPYFINIPAGCASGPSVWTKRQKTRWSVNGLMYGLFTRKPNGNILCYNNKNIR